MKTSALIPLSLLLLLASTACAVEVDAIAARVDSDVILKSDVTSEMRRSGATPDRYEEIRNEMIERRLIINASKEMKMTMQDWVVENRVREIIKKAFDGDRNRLLETLAKEKISYPEWHQRLKEDMVVSAMRWQVVEKNAVPSPTALREEFKTHPERYAESKKTTVSVILLKPEDADKRQEVQNELKEQSFADVARKYSADAHAADGGVWKDVNPDEVFRPEVCEEISKMPKGTLSHWIDLDGWSFLLRKDAEQQAHAKSFAEAFDDVEANVREQMAEKLYKEWIERLKAASYIKIFDS